MAMDPRIPAIADHLLLIEHEMRIQGLWSDAVHGADALASTEPFSVDRLEFEEWVQWIFLPKMKLLIEQGQPLPSVSGIAEMAGHVFGQRRGNWKPLLKHFKDFDLLISTSA